VRGSTAAKFLLNFDLKTIYKYLGHCSHIFSGYSLPARDFTILPMTSPPFVIVLIVNDIGTQSWYRLFG
jgi:hypothetical protein